MNEIKRILCSNLNSKSMLLQLRFYPRWSHRRPGNVLLPEEYEAKEYNTEENLDTVGKAPPLYKANLKVDSNPNKYKIGFSDSTCGNIHAPIIKIPLTLRRASEATKTSTANEDVIRTVIDECGNPHYTKMKNNDPRVGKVLAEVKSKNLLQKRNSILLEGRTLIRDALEIGCQLKYILYSRKSDIEYLKPWLPSNGAELLKLPYRELQLWSELVTSPGIMGIFQIPNLQEFNRKDSIPLTVLCDNIREPGNLGAILRTCSGVGCERVILTKGCVSLWDSKVIRSAMGAHFRLQIHKKLNWDEIKDVTSNSSVFIAENHIIKTALTTKDSLVDIINNIPVVPYYSVNFSNAKKILLIIGGETEGISEESYNLASVLGGIRLNIPLCNHTDSLNSGTALGILSFEIKKQFAKLMHT